MCRKFQIDNFEFEDRYRARDTTLAVVATVATS